MDCIQRSGFPAEDEWQHLGVHIFECAGGSCSFFVAKSAVRKELVFSFRGTTSGNQLLWQVYMGLLHDAWDFPNPDELKKSRGFGDLLHMDKLKSFLTMKPWGKIHKYFGQAFYQIWPDLRAAYCLPKEYKDYTFIFTGHSLGGALASLAAAQTLVENYKKSDQIVLYTFGQPRIGNYAFAMRHSQMIPNSYRIVNGEDGVVHVGPCRKNVPSPQFLKCYSQITDHPLAETKKICIHNESKFYHQGTEVWFNEEMVYDWRGVKHKVCRGMPQNEDIGCSAGVDFDRNRVKFYYTHHSFYYGKMVSAFGKSGCKIERNPFKRVFEQKKSEALLERELFKEMNGGNGANVDAETRHKAFDEMADRIEELQKMDEENDEEAAFSEEMRFEDIHQMSLPEKVDVPLTDFGSRQIAIAKSESILNSMDAFSGPVIEQELRKICNKMQKLRLTPFEAMEFSKSMQNFLGNGKNTLSRRTNRVSELLISLLASLGIHQNCALGSFAARLLGRTRHEFEEGKCMANASVKVNFEAATEAMAKLTEDHCAATAEKQQIVKMKSFCVEQIQIDCYDWKTLSKEVAELVQKLTDFCHAKFFEMKVDEELEYYKNLLAFIKSGGFQEKLRRIQEKFPRVIKSSRFGVVGKERLKSEIDRFAHAIGQLLPKVGQIRTKVERTQSEWTKFEADRNKKIVETNQELGNISRIRAIGDEIHANRLHSQLEESRKSIKGVEKKQTAKREEIDKEMRPISAVDRQCWTVRGWLFEIGQECKKKIGNNEA